MDSIKDLLHKKADTLDDGKRQIIHLVQAELDRLFGGSVKVVRIDKKLNLLVEIPSPALSSELRLKQIEILDAINGGGNVEIAAIHSRVSVR